MFCHLNYNFDKLKLRDYFFDNFDKAKHHKTAGSELKFWIKLFDNSECVNQIIDDLNLFDLNVIPRFSFQYKNTRLFTHIDIDRIIGINLNLMEEPATIHINNKPYQYESALIDVGSKVHSVEPIKKDRLVLKFAIRNSWNEVYSRLKTKNLLRTISDDYESILKEEDLKFVRL